MAPSRMFFFTTIHQSRRLDFRQSMIIVTNESFEILSRYHTIWTSIEIVDTPGCAALVPAQIVPSEESKKFHLEDSIHDNSPDLGKIEWYVDNSDLPMLRNIARRSISNGRGATIHQIRAKITRAYANFLASWATSRANNLSLSADKRQFTELGQNQK
eukprot:scaffold9792_cov74-Cylindrotheca_fusiformis.AAC.1